MASPSIYGSIIADNIVLLGLVTVFD